MPPTGNDEPVEEVAEAPGVPRHRRLGRAVKVPEEKLAFITEEALEQILAPEALNSGNVVDIYQLREADFLATSTLDVTYHDASGAEVTETLFVDSLYPTHHPRVCVSVDAVQAMHRAITVLTRKVDNLTMTLRTCREHYYKELFYLRHGRPAEQEHEVYWFSPRAYQDTVTKDLLRAQLNGREAELQEMIDERDKELDRLRLNMTFNGDEMVRLKRILSQMPVEKVVHFMRKSTLSREDEFMMHIHKMLLEWKGVDEENTNEASRKRNIIERLENTESKVKQLDELLLAANVRNSTLCKQVKSLGGVPGMLEDEPPPPDAETRDQDLEQESLRLKMRLEMIEENNREQAYRNDAMQYSLDEDLKKKVTEATQRAVAWEAETRKLLERLRACQKELTVKSTELEKAKKLLSKEGSPEPKAKRRSRGSDSFGEEDVVGRLRSPSAGPLLMSPAASALSTPLSTSLSPDSSPDRKELSPRGSPRRRRASRLTPHQDHRHSVADGSRRTSANSGAGIDEAGEEPCACGASLAPDMAFCARCGMARKDLTHCQPLPRRRPRSAPLERNRRFSVVGPPGRRDDWWKDAPLQEQVGGSSGSRSPGPEELKHLGPRSRALQRRRTDASCHAEVLLPLMSPRIDLIPKGIQTTESFLATTTAMSAASGTEELSDFVLVNNLKEARMRGIPFCSSKHPDSRREIVAEWGTSIVGCDEGDGWVRVGDHYLPKAVDGVPVLLPQTVSDYDIAGGDEGLEGEGLPYYFSKHPSAAQSNSVAEWGTAILAADEGDEWVRVGNHYLPKEVGGIPVLQQEAMERYIVCRGRTDMDTPGLHYCLRKRMDTATIYVADWGTSVAGTDGGDGWVSTGEYYLPKHVQGVPVLVLEAKKNWTVCDAQPAADTPGIPRCTQKNPASQCGWELWGSTVRGIDQGDGWVKVGDLYLPKTIDGADVLNVQAQCDYRVSECHPRIKTPGLPYCSSTNLDAKTSNVAKWGTVVRGEDDGNGWVKVDNLYLPLVVDGLPVLTCEGFYDFTVCTGHPNIDLHGIPYLPCKTRPGPEYGRLAEWGSSIKGSDEGDGWIKLGEQAYLPKVVGGKPMVILQERREYVVCGSRLRTDPHGAPYCYGKDLATRMGIAAPWGSAVRGAGAGDGWVRVGGYYLPEAVHGTRVLQALDVYRVCNEHPAVSTPSLSYFREKSLDSPSFRLVEWGSTVKGVDTGDGWIKVGNYYLPKDIKGVPLLVLCEAAPALPVATHGPESEPEPDEGAEEEAAAEVSSCTEHSSRAGTKVSTGVDETLPSPSNDVENEDSAGVEGPPEDPPAASSASRTGEPAAAQGPEAEEGGGPPGRATLAWPEQGTSRRSLTSGPRSRSPSSFARRSLTPVSRAQHHSPRPNLDRSQSGHRVHTVSVEVQTLVGFSNVLAGWCLPTPHKSWQKDKREAYELGIRMRRWLLEWCLSFVRAVDPELLSAEIVEVGLQRCWDACEELCSGKRSDDEYSRSSAALEVLSSAARVMPAMRPPKVPSNFSKLTAASRPVSRASSKVPADVETPLTAPSGQPWLNLASGEAGRQSSRNVASQTDTDLPGFKDGAAVPVADACCSPVEFGDNLLPLRWLQENNPFALSARPRTRASVLLPESGSSPRSGDYVLKAKSLPAPEVGNCRKDSKLPRTPTVEEAQPAEQDFLGEGAVPCKDFLGESASLSEDSYIHQTTMPSKGPEEHLPRGTPASEVSIQEKNEGSEVGLAAAPGGPDARRNAVAGTSGRQRTSFPPLRRSDLVTQRWPAGQYSNLTKSNRSIVPVSTGRRSVAKGNWRHEVAQGGVSNRDSETIIHGSSRQRPVVETPPLQGGPGGSLPRRQLVEEDTTLDVTVTRPPHDATATRPHSQRSRASTRTSVHRPVTR